MQTTASDATSTTKRAETPNQFAQGPLFANVVVKGSTDDDDDDDDDDNDNNVNNRLLA